jgi:hypothetical protein
MRRIFACLSIASLTLGLTGCQHSPGGDGKDRLVGDGEVYVVGRIDIIPPLSAAEQELRTITSDRLKNRGYVLLSDQFIDMDKLGMGSGRHAVLVDMNKHFVVKRKRFQDMHYSGVLILMKSTATHSGYMGRTTTINTGQLRLPGKTIYKIRPEDKAVYIGTLRYHRDDYNAIKRVQYVDEYNEALKEFHALHGSKIALRRVKPGQGK